MEDKTKLKIYKTEWLELSYGSYVGMSEVRTALNDKKNTVKNNEEATYRMINHWAELGLIENANRDGAWRRFSFIDLVWQKIIMQLREFGLSNEKILNTKKSLFCTPNNNKDLPTLFEFYIAACIFQKVAVEILVFKDGSAEIATKEDLFMSEMLRLPNEDYFSINLNNLIKQFLPKHNENEVNSSYFKLNQEEIKLYDDIASCNFNKITLHLNGDGRITEKEKQIIPTDKKRVVDMIREEENQDIYVKVRKGRVVGQCQVITEKTEPKQA